MSVLRRMLTAGGGLAVALMAAPVIALQAQVVAPGTNPKSTNPAPTPNPATTPSESSVTAEMRNDLPFLRAAASANLMEVSLGRLAQTQASDRAVKEFGQRMVTDHSSLQQQLTTMTSSNGVGFSPALDMEQQQEVNRLQRLSGPEFDRAYMGLMIQDHQADVTHFENQGRGADAPQVRDLVARTLPVLQQHLSLAQEVGRQVNAEVATTPVRRSKVPVTNPNAQTTPQQAQSREADVRADRRFIYEVAVDNMLEASMARLAQKKAESSAVRQFAERVGADHSQLQEDWVGMASRNGQQFRVGMGKNHRAKLDRIKKLSGRAFDRAYMTTVIQDHKDYIDYFEKEGRSAHSTQVRQLVERDLPGMRARFNQAKQIGAQVGADTSATIRSERVSARN